MASSSIVEIPANQQIPIDLTMTKRIPGVTRGKLRVTDAHGNLVYQLDGRSALSSPYKYKKILVDSFGNPQISIVQNKVSLIRPKVGRAENKIWGSVEHQVLYHGLKTRIRSDPVRFDTPITPIRRSEADSSLTRASRESTHGL